MTTGYSRKLSAKVSREVIRADGEDTIRSTLIVENNARERLHNDSPRLLAALLLHPGEIGARATLGFGAAVTNFACGPSTATSR